MHPRTSKAPFSLVLFVVSWAQLGCGQGGTQPRSQEVVPTEEVEEAQTPATTQTDPERLPTDPSQNLHPPEDPFEVPLDDTPCGTTRVAIRHSDAETLPGVLEYSAALRSDDGRILQIGIASEEVSIEPSGAFAAPTQGDARFEFEALRTRRRALTPMTLGPPTRAAGALTHARIVHDGPYLTFGSRLEGHVQLTFIDETRVCGRVDISDESGRARGVFNATVSGPIPP